MMNTTEPNRPQNVSDLVLLIQLLERQSASIESVKGLQQSQNATLSMIIEQLIGVRGDLTEWMNETKETRSLRTGLDIQALESKDAEYKLEMEKISKAQTDIHTALEALKSGKGYTGKMKAIAAEEVSKDKIDIRGVKISSRQFTYVLIGAILLLAMVIVLQPQAVSEILMRLAGMIGNGSP